MRNICSFTICMGFKCFLRPLKTSMWFLRRFDLLLQTIFKLTNEFALNSDQWIGRCCKFYNVARLVLYNQFSLIFTTAWILTFWNCSVFQVIQFWLIVNLVLILFLIFEISSIEWIISSTQVLLRLRCWKWKESDSSS